MPFAIFNYSIQYNNQIHKGILLDLLIKEKNDTLSPFFPLQKYPHQQKEVDEIIKSLEKDILKILEKTKMPLIQTRKEAKTKRRRKYYSKKTIPSLKKQNNKRISIMIFYFYNLDIFIIYI